MIGLLLYMLKSDMYNDLIILEADDSDDIIEVIIPKENILPYDKDDNYIDDEDFF